MSIARFSRLRARLLLLVLIALAPMFGLIAYMGLEGHRDAQELSQREAIWLARLSADHQQQLLSETQHLLFVLSQLPQIRQRDWGACSMLLATVLRESSRYANLAVIDAEGSVRCSAVPTPRAVTLGDRGYFQAAKRNGRFSVGGYQIGRITGVPVVVAAYPLRTREGAFSGVVYAALRLDWLNMLVPEPLLPPGATVTIVDAQQTVLVRHPQAALWTGHSARASDLFAASGVQAAQPHSCRDLDGIVKLCTAVTLDSNAAHPNLRLALAIPSEIAYARVHRVVRHSATFVATLMLVVIALAWFGSEVLVLRRIRSLAHATQRIGAGELQARVPSAAGGGELTQLAEAFNTMAATLQKRDQETKRQSVSIARLNRVYAMLSAINGAILRIRDRQHLLDEACRIAVEHGGFRLAWVGMPDPAEQRMQVVAAAGPCAGYAAQVTVSPSETQPQGRGPTATAMREGRPYVVNRIATDARMAPWRERALSYELHASAALPLYGAESVIGTFNLYSDEEDFFDAAELRLLEEVAGDISLGLTYIDKESQVTNLAYYDTLTNLPNRRLFEDRLEQAVARARHANRVIALAVVDINAFREINDAHGHATGDEVLRQVGRRLSGALREGDTVARLGNDEFGVLFADMASSDDTHTVAGKIGTVFPCVSTFSGEDIYLTARIGVSIYPTDGDTGATLLKNAEQALHAQSGESPVAFYSPAINRQTLERRRLEAELHRALERDEFSLHYQPVVDVKTRQIVGLEALLRWHNAQLGQVSPDRFIPLAEQNGLIHDIGLWVITAGCRQSQQWQAAGLPPLALALNVSVKQLLSEGFATRVAELLRTYDCDSNTVRLGIEITETQLMHNVGAAANVLSTLRDLGLRVYVDDFGTGYSSLSYLNSLPIDVLKVDRSFIGDMTQSANAASVAKTIIVMAHSLGLQVVAEGVETAEQLALLDNLGCDSAQGFLFSRALPADEIPPLLGKPL